MSSTILTKSFYLEYDLIGSLESEYIASLRVFCLKKYVPVVVCSLATAPAAPNSSACSCSILSKESFGVVQWGHGPTNFVAR